MLNLAVKEPRSDSMATYNQHPGLSVELLVAHDAMRHGCNVNFPYGGQAKYDLLIERGGKILKLQVKTARPYDPDNQHRQEITGLDGYQCWQVDFFAGVVDVDDIVTKWDLSVNTTRHIFYKPFDDVDGQSARVNYRDPDGMSDSEQAGAKLSRTHEFQDKIEPELPEL